MIRGSELQNTNPCKLFVFIFFNGKRMGKAARPHTSYHPSLGKPAQEVLTVCSEKGPKKQVPCEAHLSSIPSLPGLSNPHLTRTAPQHFLSVSLPGAGTCCLLPFPQPCTGTSVCVFVT